MNIEQLHGLFLTCRNANTDTRKITKDAMFFALKGDAFNGNTFASKAIEAGAKYAVVDEAEYAISTQYILVNDVLKTLQELASFHRQYLKLPILALTGSNGKTTTKELINAVLSRHFNTVATIGNLNNHIGVPLTLLSMDSTTEFGIVEMGANHLKEIEFLSNIVKPDYGYITNFGKAHLEGFGSVEGIIKGKSELYEFLIKNNKTIFVNASDPTQLEKTKEANRICFGNSSATDIEVHMHSCDPFVKVQYQDRIIQSNLIGAYNFNNIAVAIAVGHYFKVSVDTIETAIVSYIPTNNRSQILAIDSNKIILDAYNANPTSMEAAIRNLHGLSDNNKILVLGDMFELGHEAAKEHQNIVNLIESLGFRNVYLLGQNFHETKSLFNTFKSFEDFKTGFKKSDFEQSTILIKGSRGMALERVVELLK
ncbi:MAG TPA: UDP-N-acetylmuramoyl-tripeptide--D-alanyl-D-alanine ligase [Flavobacteriaceae bacterium]|nr:UDP-N-acetylmuramoyl-tripeptide--D-alanyl-D-alanine ligase [Flavobacteriaceae bacterium]